MLLPPFILLYSISNLILYVHYPFGIFRSEICFESDMNVTYIKCNKMVHEIINNNTSVFSYHMKRRDEESTYFKILYYYFNNTIFDTNWVKKRNVNYFELNNKLNSTSSNSSNETLKQIINEEKNINFISNIITLILLFCQFLLLTPLWIYFYKQKYSA